MLRIITTVFIFVRKIIKTEIVLGFHIPSSVVTFTYKIFAHNHDGCKLH